MMMIRANHHGAERTHGQRRAQRMDKGLTVDGLAGESHGSEGEAGGDWEEAYQIAYWEGYAACQLELQQLQGYAPRGAGW